MKNIKIINYFAPVNKEGKLIGHHTKAIQECINIISRIGGYDIKVISAEEMAGSFENAGFIPTRCSILKKRQNAFEKFINIIKRLININNIVTSSEKGNLLWFASVDYVLYLYLILNKGKIKRKSIKVIATVYQVNYFNSIKNNLVNNGLKHMDLVVLTNKNLTVENKHVYMPDYFYNEEVYSKYRNIEKKYVYSSVGLMKSDKELEELVEVFNKLDDNLKLMGRFADENLYNRLKENAKDNIEIVNKYLSYDEYMDTIAESEYVILPYKTALYDNKTTGVLLETLFLSSVPIAPKSILEDNEVNGIGYESIYDLEKLLKNNEYDYKQICKDNEKIVDEYRYEKFVEALKAHLDFDN